MNTNIYLDNQKLSRICIKEFEAIDIGKMMHYLLESNSSTKNILGTFYYFIRKTLFFTNDFQVKGTPNTLFLFSNSYAQRKDLLSTFDDVVNLTENHVRMVGTRTNKIHFNFIVEIGKLFVWNTEIKKQVPSFVERLYILRNLYGIYTDYLEYKQFIKEHNLFIDKLVTLCDVHATDYFFTQYFKKEGKKTVTLQHGVFSSTANAWAYQNSESDFFLANSQFSVDEALLSGYSDGQILAVGLPSFIQRKTNEEKQELFNERIGVILEGELCHDDNVEMIQFFQEYCELKNKELYIKLHPTANRAAYDSVMNSSCIKEICGTEKNILGFAESIDVAIVRNTTSLLELINQDIPCFIYVSEHQKLDVYKNVKKIRFHSTEEIDELLKNILQQGFKEKFVEFKKYFGDGDSAKENYKNVLNEIGIL